MTPGWYLPCESVDSVGEGFQKFNLRILSLVNPLCYVYHFAPTVNNLCLPSAAIASARIVYNYDGHLLERYIVLV